MSMLILCGLTEQETQDFLEAERALLDEMSSKKGWGADHQTHTLRFKELPDPSDAEKSHSLGKELLSAFGMEGREFQTEYLTQNGFSFLAIYSAEEKPVTPVAVPAPAAAKPKQPVSRACVLVPVISVGVLVLLAVIYFGIGFLLARQVEARYAERDCAGLVTLAESVTQFYPPKIIPFAAPAQEQATECRAYLDAEAMNKQGSSDKAYAAYRNYHTLYPNGIYAKEARAKAAESLFAWATDQRKQQEFAASVENLTLLLDEYADTATAPQAKTALPETYFEWAADCRSKGEFSEAETVYQSLNDWATKENDQPLSIKARTELAQAYFDWGKALENNKDFASADAKFASAVSTDPNPTSADSPAAQTRAYLPEFQMAWGDYLVKQEEFSDAIQHYNTSISLSPPEKVEQAKNAVTQAYLAWADSLRKKEDYHQALDKIEQARDSATTDSIRQNVEAENSKTLDQFSRSTGSQARQAISSLTTSLCQTGKTTPGLPIFGMLEEKRLTVSGVDTTWSSNLIAMAPGNLYYVACIAETEKTIQSCPYSLTGFGAPSHWIKRIQYTWTVSLYRWDGRLTSKRSFNGGSPETCPRRHSFSYLGDSTHYHYGERPVTDSIMTWLEGFLR